MAWFFLSWGVLLIAVFALRIRAAHRAEDRWRKDAKKAVADYLKRKQQRSGKR